MSQYLPLNPSNFYFAHHLYHHIYAVMGCYDAFCTLCGGPLHQSAGDMDSLDPMPGGYRSKLLCHADLEVRDTPQQPYNYHV